MKRRRADVLAGGLIAVVIVLGGGLTWQAYLQQQAVASMMEPMMGGTTGVIHGTNPLWYGLGTLVLAAAIGGLYLSVRNDFPTDEPATATSSAPRTNSATVSDRQPRDRILDVLPEDERRILEPIMASPGITQIELRDRSDFSKSKVSQTVSDLEKRGLLYRERQGRTYRVYPSDDLHDSE